MRTKSWIFNVLLTLTFASSATAGLFSTKSVQDQMIQDLEVAKYNMSIKYGPAEWKNEHLGWTIEDAFEKAKRRILEEKPTTSSEYQKIFNQFLGSTQDYHVRGFYYSTACSFFPIEVKKVADRYYFAGYNVDIELGGDEAAFLEIDPKALEMIGKNFQGVNIGEEIVAIDDKPVQDVIEQLIDENLYGDRTPTGYELACRNLFVRRGKFSQHVPSGTFNLTLRNHLTNQTHTRTLPWLHIPEYIPDPDLGNENFGLELHDLEGNSYSKNSIQLIEQLLTKDFSVGIAKELTMPKLSHLAGENFKMLPPGREEDVREKGFLPPLGKIVWESPKADDIYAYVYQHPAGKKVAYLYLHTFDEAGQEAEIMMKQLIQAIKIFNQHNAAALVVDINNNTGGNMMYMYAVLSLLTNKPLAVPSHRELLIQEDVYKMAALNQILNSLDSQEEGSIDQQSLSGYPLSIELLDQMKAYTQAILQSWKNNERFTSPLYLFGIDKVMPHPQVRFNKPILVLINAYCLSCSDFFPAILQDNKRATLFGQRTAGAGGYVKAYPHFSRFGIQGYSLTASIGYRTNGQPIENLGVTPDIPYTPSVNDIRSNYKEYITKVNAEIKKMIK